MFAFADKELWWVGGEDVSLTGLSPVGSSPLCPALRGTRYAAWGDPDRQGEAIGVIAGIKVELADTSDAGQTDQEGACSVYDESSLISFAGPADDLQQIFAAHSRDLKPGMLQ